MTILPLISIITPTWQRHDLLINRCIPSVQAQDYPNIEHILVSDGPDPELAFKLTELWYEGGPDVRYFEIPVREDGRYGCRARRYGLERARGSLIGYNDDDDALRPQHVSKLVAAMKADPAADFARSLMVQNHPSGTANIVGYGVPAACNIGTPMILHKRELTATATWGDASNMEDWNLVEQWLAAGITYASVDEVTVDVWPSVYYGN